MLHSIHSYFSLSVRRKEKALWRLEHASDLAKSITLGHEPPKKGRCKYSPFLPCGYLLLARQVPWQVLGVFAVGVMLPDQEVPLPRGGEELLAWQREGNMGCPAAEWHG